MSVQHLGAACALLSACAALMSGHTLAFTLLMVAAAIAAVTDGLEYRIPNMVSFTTGAAALIVWRDYGYPLDALLVALVIGVLLVIAWNAGGMGGGDAKFIPSLVLAVAATGDPAVLWWRLAVFAIFLLGTAIVWALARGTKDVPLAVGGALAVAAVAG